jgi:hypothetical protein
VDVNANFTATDLNTFLADASRVNAPVGTCSLTVSRVDATPVKTGTGLNAGDSIVVNGPVGTMMAANTSSGGYSMVKSPASLTPGSYSVTSNGGSDVGPISTMLSLAAPAVWSNKGAYTVSSLPAGMPFTFAWTGADPAGYVTVGVSSANAIYNSTVQCNAAPGAGSFTVPAWLATALYAGPVTVWLTSNSAPVGFSGTGLDAGMVTGSFTTSVQTVLQAAAQ